MNLMSKRLTRLRRVKMNGSADEEANNKIQKA